MFFLLENLIIPENVTVTLSIYHVHRDPKCWEKPNEYYPEHFSAEATTKRNPYAFIPFSAGPRKCIGTSIFGTMNPNFNSIFSPTVFVRQYENIVEYCTLELRNLLPTEGGRHPVDY